MENHFDCFRSVRKASIHIPLAVVEDLFPDTKIDVTISAPAGVSGQVVIDIGFVEI